MIDKKMLSKIRREVGDQKIEKEFKELIITFIENKTKIAIDIELLHEPITESGWNGFYIRYREKRKEDKK